MFTIFNPDEQERFGVEAERCVAGNAPTLQTVVREHGKDAALRWLVLQLQAYNRWVGIRERNRICDVGTLEKIAILMLGERPAYKLTEVMLFFCKLKKGEYEKMYGFVDATKIISAYRAFEKDRAKIQWDYEHREVELTPEEKYEREYERLLGMIRLYQKNPKSHCGYALKAYCENGYLAKYNIHLDPAIFQK